MVNVKEIILKRIPSKIANEFVKLNHYSGRIVNNSQLHFGAFFQERLHGVLSFGPPFDKSKLIGNVTGTGWNEFVELNRLAFDEFLPKNSESRCISIAMKLIKKNCPHIKWIISFADAMQCGDGSIYRACGFKLIGISNGSMWELPEELKKKFGISVAHRLLLGDKHSKISQFLFEKFNGRCPSINRCIEMFGGRILEGFMFKYIYFLNKESEKNLTLKIIPYSKIKEIGGGMYKGEKRDCGVMVAQYVSNI